MVARINQMYPHIEATAMDAADGDISAVGRSCDEQYEFKFALDLLLDALEQLHHQNWNSITNEDHPPS